MSFSACAVAQQLPRALERFLVLAARKRDVPQPPEHGKATRDVSEAVDQRERAPDKERTTSARCRAPPMRAGPARCGRRGCRERLSAVLRSLGQHLSAASNNWTASRLADRPPAFAPRRRIAHRLVAQPCRAAWCASTSTTSPSRSAYSRSIASTMAACRARRQRVLERVLEIGNRLRLVEELRRLQLARPRRSSSGHARRSGEQQRERHVLADHRAAWSSRLSSGGAGRCAPPGSPAPSPAPGWSSRRASPAGRRRARRPAPRLDQRPHALLEEERIALGPLDEQPLERLEAGVVAEQRLQQLLGALGRQRIDAELAVVGLAPQACRYSGR